MASTLKLGLVIVGSGRHSDTQLAAPNDVIGLIVVGISPSSGKAPEGAGRRVVGDIGRLPLPCPLTGIYTADMYLIGALCGIRR